MGEEGVASPGAVPRAGRLGASPHTRAKRRAVGRGLGEEAGLLPVGADRKLGGGVAVSQESDQ